MRTYQIELAVAVAALCTTAVISDKGTVEWIGVLAVALSFAHMQVGDRLAEAAAKTHTSTGNVTVECFRMLQRYLIGKELCWLAYFYMLGAWSALVGVALFLLYPLWRSWYRAKRDAKIDRVVDETIQAISEGK